MKPLLAINHRYEYQDLQHEEETDGALVQLKKHVAPRQLAWVIGFSEMEISNGRASLLEVGGIEIIDSLAL